MFMHLDTSKDGILSIEEVQEGMDHTFGKLKGNTKEYCKLMKELDRNGDGVIDYTEFITAAIDK